MQSLFVLVAVIACCCSPALWHVFGLKPGEHTLRLVTLPQTDARSKGTRMTIEQAVVYRQRSY